VKRSLAAALGAVFMLAAASPAAMTLPAAGFTNARAPWQFVFPRDHAAHFAFAVEWWYFTGHLVTEDGRRFGYELTFFRYGLRPGDPSPAPGQSRWRGNQVFPAHFALTDERGGRFLYDERFAREALGMGHASDRMLDVGVEGWSLGGTSPFRLRAATEDVGIELRAIPDKPPAIHGHEGISLKGACATCASHYYSFTRLRTQGTLRYGGRRLRVAGLSWMDHEFGSDELQPGVVGWDWFAIQLDDRREIMDYRLRHRDGTPVAESNGSLVDARGRVTPLALRDVDVRASGSWTSPHTHAVYPSGWRVRIPRAGIDVTLTPTVRDQELAGDGGGVAYWEGAVDIRDARTSRHVGTGYVELTGYAGALTF